MPEILDQKEDRILVSSKIHDVDQGKWMNTEVDIHDRGVSISIKQDQTDQFAWADIHIEVCDGDFCLYFWHPDDVQRDPTKTIKVPMNTVLAWDRKTGEDIPKTEGE